MSDRSIAVVLRANVNGFVTEMGRASKSLDDLVKKSGDSSGAASTAMGRMVQSARLQASEWQQVGGSLTAVGAGWSALNVLVAKTGVSYNTLQQQSRAALTVLMNGAEGANAQMDKLDAFARTSPFAKDVFIKAQQQMLGFGIESKKVLPYLDAIQQAVAATGGSNHDIAELTRIFSQVQAAAKITAVDLMQFGQRGIDAATLIGSQMGKTGAQIRDDISNGALDAQTALDALAAGMQERFGGASANVKSTMEGAFDRVKAAWRDLSASLMEGAVDPQSGGWLVDMTNGVADLIRQFDALPDHIKTGIGILSVLGATATLAAGGFFMLAPRILASVDALKAMGILTPKVVADLSALTRVAGTALLGPVGLAAGAIMGLSVALGEASKKSMEARINMEAVDVLMRRLGGGSGVDPSRLFTVDTKGMEAVVSDVESWSQAFDELYRENANSINSSVGVRVDAIKTLVGEADKALAEMDPSGAATAFRTIRAELEGWEKTYKGIGGKDGRVITETQALVEQFDKYAEKVRAAAQDQAGLTLTTEQTVAAMEGQTVAVQTSIGGPWKTYTHVIEEATEAQEASAISALQAAGKMRKLFEGYTLTGEASLYAAEALNAANEAAEKGGDTFAQQDAALKAAGLAMRDFGTETRIMTEAQAEHLDMISGASRSFVDLMSAYDGVIAKNREVAEETAAATESSKDSWEDFYDGVTVGTQDFLKALEEQVAAQQEWQTNMLALSGRVSQGTLDYLAELGPKGAQLVKDMGTMTDAELREVEELFAAGGQTAGNNFADNLANAGPVLAAVATKMGDDAVAKVAAEIASGKYTLQQIIDRYNLRATIDANTEPAVRSARLALDRINAMTARFTVDATARITYTHRQGLNAPVATGGYMADVAEMYGLAGGGMARKRFPYGGLISGPGTPTSDSVPAMVSRDEFVQQAKAVDYYGVENMYRLNAMQIPREWLEARRFAGGGSPAYSRPPAVTAPTPSPAFDPSVIASAVASGLAGARIYMDGRVIDARIETNATRVARDIRRGA